jgi:hypothetical protein
MKTASVNQVAAFGKLVGICNDLGASYNPSKASLKPTALTTLLQQAQQNAEAVIVAHTSFTSSTNARIESFKGIQKLVSRIVRAVSASEGSEETIKDVKMLKRMFDTRSKKLPVTETPDSGAGSEEKPERSSARLDYESKVETLARIIQLLSTIPTYVPNEADLKVASLKTLLASLKTRNDEVAKAANALQNARVNRKKIVYSKIGVYGTGTAVKEYIRSIEGVRSDLATAANRIRLKSNP